MSNTQLKKTALNEAHRKHGGKMVDFGGWDMPVQYPAGTIAEHMAVRTAAGLFDGMQYLASAFVGVGMGYTLDHWGWKAWQFVPIPFAVVGAIVISRIWNATPARRSSHGCAARSTPASSSVVAAPLRRSRGST